MLTTKKPLLDQLNKISVLLDKMADDIQTCIHEIDDGDPEGARSDLVLILEDLRGFEDYE